MKTVLGYQLPNRWRFIKPFGPTGAAYEDTKTGMIIIETTSDIPGSDQDWHHLSMSFPDRIPTYDEMKLCKAVFVGGAHTSLQIFATESKHISINDYCLHLWTPLDHDVTPDFGVGGSI